MKERRRKKGSRRRGEEGQGGHLSLSLSKVDINASSLVDRASDKQEKKKRKKGFSVFVFFLLREEEETE